MPPFLHKHGARIKNGVRTNFPVRGTVGMFLVEEMTSDETAELVPYVAYPDGAQMPLSDIIGTPAFFRSQRAQGIHWLNDRTYSAPEEAVEAVPEGGRLVIPPASLADTNQITLSGGLVLNKPVHVVGFGAMSKLIVPSSLSASTDVITIDPLVAAGKRLYKLERFAVVPASGTPGRHGIHIDITNVGQWIAQLAMEDVNIHQLGGNAIRLTNPTNVDGFFCSRIIGGLIYGGIYLQRSGDSVQLKGVTSTGTNCGLEASFVSGAAQTVLEDCNITNAGGAVIVHNGDQVKLLRNQIEQTTTYTGTQVAAVTLKGDAAQMTSVSIDDGNINVRDYLPYCVSVENAAYTKIGHVGNLVLNCANARKHINIGASAVATSIGDNIEPRVNDAGGLALRIDDAGTQTFGPPIAVPSFSNGWTSYDAVNSPVKYRRKGRLVTLEGAVKSGTTTAGTTIFVLPAGFRPSHAQRFAVSSNNAGTWTTGSVQITAGGSVQIMAGFATVLDFSGISFEVAL